MYDQPAYRSDRGSFSQLKHVTTVKNKLIIAGASIMSLKFIGKTTLLVSMLATAGIAFAEQQASQQPVAAQQVNQLPVAEQPVEQPQAKIDPVNQLPADQQQAKQQPAVQSLAQLQIPCPSVSTVKQAGELLTGYNHFSAQQGGYDVVYTEAAAFQHNNADWYVGVILAPGFDSQQDAKSKAKELLTAASTMKSEYAEHDGQSTDINICYYGENNEVMAVSSNTQAPQQAFANR